jgi:hypothetical protein
MRRDMTKLLAAFRNFANTPKKRNVEYLLWNWIRSRVRGSECLKDPQRDIRTLNVRNFKLWAAVKETEKHFQVS